jgi:hypothetical protein
MFIAVYEFKVKPGKEKEFEESWATVTDNFIRSRGTHGSRLHKTDQEQVYVGYASGLPENCISTRSLVTPLMKKDSHYFND